jgi:hypothetical protein
MTPEPLTLAAWLQQAHVAEDALTPEQHALLLRAFSFRQRCGRDYYSTRLLSHFLLHSEAGLSVAAIARLLGLSRSAASAQQGLSSKEVIQAAHHRLRGRAHGKLLPRFAGPIAQFLHAHPEASRYDLLDFVERTWNLRVSRMALYQFLKKYGLDQAHDLTALPLPGTALPPAANPADAVPPLPTPVTPPPTPTVEATPVAPPEPGQAVPLPPRDFFLPPRSTPGRSCCCRPPRTGLPRPSTASPTTTGPCSADC